MRRALPLLVLLFAVTTAPVALGYNITKILAGHPDFSTFNHYLSVTHLADEINRRQTITVLVVDNSGMSDLLAKHLTLLTLRNVLSLHILTDYYGSKKLHQLTGGSNLAASVFQSSGDAPGTTGYINITDHRAGKVTFTSEDAGGAPPVSFVKSIKEMPYDLSVLQVNKVMTSPEAEAPVAAPPPVNLTELMSEKSCKAFADLLIAHPAVLQTIQDNLDTGLTVFCPDDAAIKAFAAKYKNLTTDEKSSLLLYHAVAVFYSPQLLKTHKKALSTLATDSGSKNFRYSVKMDGSDITLDTKIVIATITSTIINQDPAAIYVLNKVLQPGEMFKAPDTADAPAEAPAGTKKGKHKHESPSPAGPDEAPSDEAVSDNSAFSAGAASRWIAAAALSVAVALVL